MKVVKQFVIVSLMLFMAGCAGNDSKVSSRPDWVDNPGDRVVGKCGTHVRGLIAQEECAYKKGLTYIALSKGVKVDVDAKMTMLQTSSGRSSSNQGTVNAKLDLEGRNIQVKAHIVDKWHDKVRDILYVLIEED
ncbi:MAG TPA: hypothetical protein ENJ64_02085 [Thiotrichales bacterium]|nr:hypothetical protein [Thiotrichales bacterium]